MLLRAQSYNSALLENASRFELDDAEMKEYKSQLDVTGHGEIGYIEIPKIGVSIPIYHTTDPDILQFAVGHLPGSSLPVGGVGTHCVVSGHRGLPSAKLFSDLDRMKAGDTFTVNVLMECETYEVDKILTVDPDNTEPLAIDPDKDYFTLITCTPYGVNTHRLLVRGHRVATVEDGNEAYFSSEAIQIEPTFVAPVVALPMLIVLFLVLLIGGRRRKRRQKLHEE